MDDRLTIVGPEPSGGAPPAPARVNIEALLLMATYDDEFRDLLLSDRPRALGESGISFLNAERLLSHGVAPKNEADIEKRTEKSRRAAVPNAQYHMLEKFIGARIEAGGIVSDEYGNRMTAYRAEIKDIVLKGQVIAEKWNADQECAVIFQVRKPGLRHWVQSE